MLMGAMQNNPQKKANGRGTVKNGERLAAFGGKAQQSGSADWSTALPARIQGVVVAVGKLGGAVTFGYSRDGGAYMCTLLLDGDRKTLWFNGDADIDAELQEVEDVLDQLQG